MVFSSRDDKRIDVVSVGRSPWVRVVSFLLCSILLPVSCVKLWNRISGSSWSSWRGLRDDAKFLQVNGDLREWSDRYHLMSNENSVPLVSQLEMSSRSLVPARDVDFLLVSGRAPAQLFVVSLFSVFRGGRLCSALVMLSFVLDVFHERVSAMLMFWSLCGGVVD